MLFSPTGRSFMIFTPVVQYMLQTAYDLEGRHSDQLEWLPAYIWQPNKQQIWQAFVDAEPDIVCLSIFLWNADILHYLAKRIREEYPETVILLGGPDVNWKDPENFCNQFPYYDYICYGDGEQTFINLIDAIFDNKTSTLDLLNIKNLIFRDKKGKVYCTPHELYKGKIYTDYSPWLHCKDTFIKDCDEIKARTGYAPLVAWESDRGCPYDCSFCDWESGLHHKVIRKKFDQFDEITLFAENGCQISYNNANFGMFDKDSKIIEYVWTLIKSGQYPGFSTYDPSWAKLHKDKVHAIYRMKGEIFGHIELKAAFQSLTPEVLVNIDRPTMPWPEYKKMLLDMKQDYKVKLIPELMTGLPGETRESWDAMMQEFIDLAPIDYIISAPWHMLPNTPGSDPVYIEKHKLNIISTIIPMDDACHRDYLDWTGYTDDMIMEHMLESASSDNMPFCYRSDIVWENYSANLEDHIYMQYTIPVIMSLIRLNNETEFLRKNYNHFRSFIWDRAQRDGEKFRKSLDKYGVMPFYVLIDNKLYNPSSTNTQDIKIRNFLNLSSKL